MIVRIDIEHDDGRPHSGPARDKVIRAIHAAMKDPVWKKHGNGWEVIQ